MGGDVVVGKGVDVERSVVMADVDVRVETEAIVVVEAADADEKLTSASTMSK